jgi:CRISPR-associated protein Cas1
MQIVLDTYGIDLSVRNRCFLITHGDDKRLVHPSRVTSILITRPCRLSSPAILLAASNEIALTICSLSGKPEAKLWSPRFANTSALRRKQYTFTTSPPGMEWIKQIIAAKLNNQIANLKFIADRKPAVTAETGAAIAEITRCVGQIEMLNSANENCAAKIRYFEAVAARNYWQRLGTKLPPPFYFTHRIKKGATDSFNPAINYLYAMLRNHVETGILSFGLDPALACMHRDGYNLPSLVFDLMEPFRPIIDRLLIEHVLAGKLNGIAAPENGECRLTREGRKKLIEQFNEKLQKTMLYKKAKTNLTNHILLEIKLLANEIRNHET